MNDIAIRAAGLSKQYRIGGRQERYQTLRECIAGARHEHGRAKDTIWALRNLDLEIRRGEVAGIIGRNGAGKTTLLKILSRITPPTEGYAEITGRAGSLLEVGTGFHQELTGRENIFLSGAILGMRRAEIQRKFDEIAGFAEVGKFVDTPVKHFSTGMYLRLAFAVAAHLEPEVLLVDEVLAVGDLAFQNRCLGKMGEVARQGRTVLFVSHNMAAVRSLCEKGILLEQGRLAFSGPVGPCIQSYVQSLRRDAGEAGSNGAFGPIRINGAAGDSVSQGEPFSVSTALRLDSDTKGMFLFLILEDASGRTVLHLREDLAGPWPRMEDSGLPISVHLPALWLNPGPYTLYFKVLPWGAATASRHVSEKRPLDVRGIGSQSESVLHLRAAWSLGPR